MLIRACRVRLSVSESLKVCDKSSIESVARELGRQPGHGTSGGLSNGPSRGMFAPRYDGHGTGVGLRLPGKVTAQEPTPEHSWL